MKDMFWLIVLHGFLKFLKPTNGGARNPVLAGAQTSPPSNMSCPLLMQL